ncbi:MAG TPA: SDR family NAD(P)-dependent oxidoreductase [Alphaproteobacteria bacterium]
MSTKNILITGASRGIGKALATKLGQQGAQIIALARTVGGLEEMDDAIQSAGGKPALLVPTDLNDIKSISMLGTQLAKRFEQIDHVIGCASLLTKLGPLMHSPLVHLQQSLQLNVLANGALLQSLHPLLVKAEKPEVTFLINKIDRDAKPFWGHYATSQSALRTMMEIYAAENKEIKVNLLEPPATDTWLFREAYPGFVGEINTPEQTADWFLEAIK